MVLCPDTIWTQTLNLKSGEKERRFFNFFSDIRLLHFPSKPLVQKPG